MPDDASSSSDRTRNRTSKIYVNPGYLWTERGPEMHNKPHMNRQESSSKLPREPDTRRVSSDAMGDTRVRSAISQGDARPERAGRRSREAARRARRVEFSLTDGEFGELGAAAAQAGLSRGAYAAEATLAAARGGPGRV